MGLREDLAKLSAVEQPHVARSDWKRVLECAVRLHDEYTQHELLAVLAAVAVSERR